MSKTEIEVNFEGRVTLELDPAEYDQYFRNDNARGGFLQLAIDAFHDDFDLRQRPFVEGTTDVTYALVEHDGEFLSVGHSTLELATEARRSVAVETVSRLLRANGIDPDVTWADEVDGKQVGAAELIARVATSPHIYAVTPESQGS